WGAEGNVLLNLCRRRGWQFDFLFGIRYLDLEEDLELSAESVNKTTGTKTFVEDSFDARNQFYGGQVGFKLRWESHRWSVDAVAKLAAGTTHRSVDVIGSTTVGASTFAGGFLAEPSNIGQHSNDTFGYVPQGQVKVAFELFPNLYLIGGYDFLYWNNVF